MRKVFKYPLHVSDEQVIHLPRGTKILSVAEQRNEIVLYAMVELGECRLYPQTVYIHGTGHFVHAENLRFLGTVNLHDGDLMLHVFIQEAQS